MESSRSGGRGWGRAIRGRAPPPNAPPARSPLEPNPQQSEGVGRSRGRGTASVPSSTSIESSLSKLTIDPTRTTRGTCRQRPAPQVTPPKSLTAKQGKGGLSIKLTANYFSFEKLTDWTLYVYRIDFSPDFELTSVRKALMRQHTELFGAYLFDGTVLFTRVRLPNTETEVVSEDKVSKSPVKITIKLVKDLDSTDMSYLQLYNLIFRKCLASLNLQLVGRDYYDAAAKILIPGMSFELWPGYQSSVRQCEDSILLNVDVTHKVMRHETAYHLMEKCREKGGREWKDQYLYSIIGCVVITRYNNKTYRIDDVDYDSTPKSTFDGKKGPICYIDYYKERYNLRISNHLQPLLVSRPSARDVRAGRDKLIVLIPELCCLTGLNDQMRNDFQLMRALAEHTRVRPAERVKAIEDGFMRRMISTEVSCKELASWNMKVIPKLVTVDGRVLPTEKIFHGDNKFSTEYANADFSRCLRGKRMLSSVELNEWVIIYPRDTRNDVHTFLRTLKNASSSFDLRLKPPYTEEIENSSVSFYVQTIERVVSSTNPSLVMCILPNNKSDRYQAIKKKCCIDRAVPSQVVLARNLTSKSAMSIATKIAIQINCKLGGAPWTVSVPFGAPVMVAGFDVCHDTMHKGRSFGALVTSLDTSFSRYYSSISHHSGGEELSNDIAVLFQKAVMKFIMYNNAPPAKIIFYRDGVGEGNIHYVLEHEVELIKNALRGFYSDPIPLAVVIVSKRINTRIFFNNDNPPPGTVIDSVITNPSCYDFYLVSQSVKQGTVSPTYYNVIYDTTGLSADIMQKLSYKMTHLYYNWSGTVRVPAPCQYAHKLAFLAAQYLHRQPNEELCELLYFL